VSHFGAGLVTQHIYVRQCAISGAVCTTLVSNPPFLCHIIFKTGDATLDALRVHTAGNNLEQSAYTCALQHSGNYNAPPAFSPYCVFRVSELHQPVGLCNADRVCLVLGKIECLFVYHLYEFEASKAQTAQYVSMIYAAQPLNTTVQSMSP
jgi:hypothetical protein